MMMTFLPSRNRFPPGLVLIVLMLSTLCGCSMFSPDPIRFSTTRTYDETFQTVRDALGRRYEMEVADPEAGRIRTDWEVLPGEFQKERFRLISRIHRDRPHKKAVTVTLRSEVQEVESGMESLSNGEVEWEDQPRKKQLERDLLDWIRMQLRVDERKETILRKAERGARREQRLRELRRKQESPPGEESD